MSVLRRTSSKSSFRLRTFLKISAILLAGVLGGLAAGLAANTVYRKSLTDRSRTAALAVDATALKRLPGRGTDIQLRNYTAVKNPMYRLHQANSDSRFVYVMGQHGGTPFFYADSEPPSSSDYSPPGQTFDEASPALRAMFVNHRDLIEGPIRDRWGLWLSALSPITDPKTGEFLGVLGIDIPATEYLAVCGAAAALPIVIAIIAATMVGVVAMTRRRRQQLIELKAELISIISHELNSPLTGIRWGAETLLGTPLNKTQQSLTEAIEESSDRLQENIEDILELTRLGYDGLRPKMAPADMAEIVTEVFATQKLPAKQKHITLTLDHSWPKQLEIVCDGLKIRRVFHNLISNAIKYGRPHSHVRVGYVLANGRHRVWVKDEGIGIPAAEQPKIFDGFYRASNAVASGQKGTGLGLFLSRSIVEQHGGKLWLTSTEDQGTTVYLELPSQPLRRKKK